MIEEPKAALFQSIDAAGAAADGPGARAAGRPGDDQAAGRDRGGLPPSTCCHTFRATGITAYLSNGDTLEHAQHTGLAQAAM